jgi:hypothetical protein
MAFFFFKKNRSWVVPIIAGHVGRRKWVGMRPIRFGTVQASYLNLAWVSMTRALLWAMPGPEVQPSGQYGMTRLLVILNIF